MDVRNCPRCGNIFLFHGFRLCESCRGIEDKEYEIVKAFLQANPGTTVEIVADKTGVSRQQILYFIRSGRLYEEIKYFSELPLYCERCEKPITQGKLCKECQNELTQSFLKTQAKLREDRKQEEKIDRKGARVHFLDKSRDVDKK